MGYQGRQKRKSAKQESEWKRLFAWRQWGRSRASRAVGVGVLVAAVVLVVATGMKALESLALRRSGGPATRTVEVRIVDLPQWMPKALARQIARGIVPADAEACAPDLPERVYRLGASHPWIRSIGSVRRSRYVPGRRLTLELRAEFRKPAALAGRDGRYFFIDPDGVRLPGGQVPRWVATVDEPDGSQRQVCYQDEAGVPPGREAVRIHYILIEGVRGEPPAPGGQWAGADLTAGLRLLKLITDRPYANQITVIDVRNHGGRISPNQPHLRMFAQIGRDKPPTEIRFGRFPDGSGSDYVVSPQRKMSYLDQYVDAHGGRLAGLHSYLDLRYDALRLSLN